jgi:hypothetical protein
LHNLLAVFFPPYPYSPKCLVDRRSLKFAAVYGTWHHACRWKMM